MAKPLSVWTGFTALAAVWTTAPGMRDSNCAGPVKSSWVMPSNNRKTIWKDFGSSVIGLLRNSRNAQAIGVNNLFAPRWVSILISPVTNRSCLSFSMRADNRFRSRLAASLY